VKRIGKKATLSLSWGGVGGDGPGKGKNGKAPKRLFVPGTKGELVEGGSNNHTGGREKIGKKSPKQYREMDGGGDWGRGKDAPNLRGKRRNPLKSLILSGVRFPETGDKKLIEEGKKWPALDE